MQEGEPIYLSKSDFLNGRKCQKRLWLDKWRSELAAKKTAADFERIETGLRVGDLARKLYPSGQFVPRGENREESASNTRAMIVAGADCLFEATFIDGSRHVRVDILRRLSNDEWALDEVKSATVKDPKELLRKGSVADVEFQSQVLEECGIRVSEKSLVLINGKYMHPGGEYDLANLYSKVRVDDECEKIRLAVEVDAAQFLRVIHAESPPEIETNTHCEGCPYFDHCHQDQPKNCVTFLPGIRAKKVNELRKLGYPTIDLVPDDFELDERMTLARKVVVSGISFVSEKLASALSEIRLPTAYVDFESYMPALPKLVGTRPYQQICFQWSAHIKDSQKSELRHHEFLFDGPDDPREDFCRTLLEAVQGCNTILFYTVFEKVRLKEMADAQIPYASQILRIFEERGIDLHAIVKDNVYLAEFKGRSSIKNVLPALVADLSYKGMAIADGNSASAAYLEMISEDCTREKREQLRRELLDYCALDTMAMVRVLERLHQLTAPQQQSRVTPKIKKPQQLEFAFES